MAVSIKDYVWRGCSLIAVHTIGRYDIVEYWNKPASNVADQTRTRDFGTYIDGEKTGCCYASMDEALAGCIAVRHEGMNGRADRYFMAMIGALVEPEKEPRKTAAE